MLTLLWLFSFLPMQEIARYVTEATGGANSDDPFEGMSPEEINEYIAKHGAPKGF